VTKRTSFDGDPPPTYCQTFSLGDFKRAYLRNVNLALRAAGAPEVHGDEQLVVDRAWEHSDRSDDVATVIRVRRELASIIA